MIRLLVLKSTPYHVFASYDFHPGDRRLSPPEVSPRVKASVALSVSASASPASSSSSSSSVSVSVSASVASMVMTQKTLFFFKRDLRCSEASLKFYYNSIPMMVFCLN